MHAPYAPSPWTRPRGHAARTARRMQVGAITVSAEERNAFGAQVEQFRQDVAKLAGPYTPGEVQQAQTGIADVYGSLGMRTCKGLGLTWNNATHTCSEPPDPTFASYPAWSFNPDYAAFRESYVDPFVTDWLDYQTSWGQSIGVARFEELKQRFLDLVETWRQQFGQQTSAVPPPVNDPDNVFDKSVNATPWIVGGLVLLAAGVGLAYALPAILPFIAARRRGES